MSIVDSCEHSRRIGTYQRCYSPTVTVPPLLRIIQSTFWDLQEDQNEDLVLPGQMIRVSYYTIEQKSIRVEFQSKRVDCSKDHVCWIRYIVCYFTHEPSPCPYDLDVSIVQ
jgi:hypothetical protein